MLMKCAIKVTLKTLFRMKHTCTRGMKDTRLYSQTRKSKIKMKEDTQTPYALLYNSCLKQYLVKVLLKQKYV